MPFVSTQFTWWFLFCYLSFLYFLDPSYPSPLFGGLFFRNQFLACPVFRTCDSILFFAATLWSSILPDYHVGFRFFFRIIIWNSFYNIVGSASLHFCIIAYFLLPFWFPPSFLVFFGFVLSVSLLQCRSLKPPLGPPLVSSLFIKIDVTPS